MLDKIFTYTLLDIYITVHALEIVISSLNV